MMVKVGLMRRSEMEWVLAKAKYIKQHKTLVTKSNFKSKFKAIKMSRKSKITRTTNNSKMTLTCKDSLMVKCIPSNKTKMMDHNSNRPNQYQMSKWVKSTIRKDNKTWKTNKAKLKVRNKLILILKVKRRASKSLSIIKEKKIKKSEKVNKIDKTSKSKSKNKDLIGKITISKVKR